MGVYPRSFVSRGRGHNGLQTLFHEGSVPRLHWSSERLPQGDGRWIVVAETAAARDIELITATQTNSDGMLFEIWTP